MQTVNDADAAAKTRTGNLIFWATIATYLGLIGLFMLDKP